MMRTTSAVPLVGRRFHTTRIGKLLAASALIGATACGGDSGTAPSKAVAGVYSLEKVARVSLPVQVYEGPFYHVDDQRSYEDFVVIMTSGLLQLTEEGSYQTTLNYTAYKDGEEEIGSLRAWGTYTVADDEIFLKRDNGIDFGSGKLEGGGVVLSLDVIGKGVSKPYAFER